jgi:LacI family transcriptional regulator
MKIDIQGVAIIAHPVLGNWLLTAGKRHAIKEITFPVTFPVTLPNTLKNSKLREFFLPTKSAITIHDVAAAAGVREVIRELGYASSLAARSMRSRRTNVLGLIVPDLAQPYSLLVTKGVQRMALASGYDLLVYASAIRNAISLANREQQQVALLNGSVTDGLIIVTPHARSYRTTYPLVAVDPHSENADFAAVLSTNFRGVQAAMNYLLDLGHRRIGFIGGRPDLQSAVRRLEGYRHSLASHGLALDETLVKVGNYERPVAHQAALELLDAEPRVTAIMAASDDMAFGVYDAAAELGLRIPGQLSVVGFDNIPDALLIDPPLTTVDQAIESMGELAAEVVIKLISGQEPERLVYKVPTHLVVRQSCRPLPVTS